MDQEEKSLLAAELVLGLLDETERRRVISAYRDDAEFRDEMRLWQARFASLEDVAEVRPSGRVFDRAYSEIFDRRPPRRFWVRHFWAEARAPEYRRLTVTTLVLKALVLLAFLLWLF